MEMVECRTKQFPITIIMTLNQHKIGPTENACLARTGVPRHNKSRRIKLRLRGVMQDCPGVREATQDQSQSIDIMQH